MKEITPAIKSVVTNYLDAFMLEQQLKKYAVKNMPSGLFDLLVPERANEKGIIVRCLKKVQEEKSSLLMRLAYLLGNEERAKAILTHGEKEVISLNYVLGSLNLRATQSALLDANGVEVTFVAIVEAIAKLRVLSVEVLCNDFSYRCALVGEINKINLAEKFKNLKLLKEVYFDALRRIGPANAQDLMMHFTVEGEEFSFYPYSALIAFITQVALEAKNDE